jgi:signal transduction histidine kinase
MSTQPQSNRMPIPQSVASYVTRELTGIVSLIAVAAYDIGSSSPELATRIPLIILYLLFIICFISLDAINLRRPVSGNVALAVLAGIQLLLIYFDSSPTAQIILLFVLSAYAHEALPARNANLWIIGFGIASMIGFSILTNNAIMGSLIGLGALGGYVYIGAAARNRRSAEEARAESQRLLQELQAAHEQLKIHAHEAEVLAATEERNRVARELHDTLGHRLTVAAVQLEGAQKLISRDTNKAIQMVGVVREQVLDALTELRQTVATLRTPIEADLALPAPITLLANQYASATGLQVHVQISDDVQPYLDRLSRTARHTLLRATQEGLTNVQKHAHASAAWIQLELTSETPPAVRLIIHDNGFGFQAAGNHGSDDSAQSRSFGLAGLAERAAQSNGTVRLGASLHGGSALVVTVPIEEANAPTPSSLPVEQA